MEFALQPGHDFSCAKKNNNNRGTGLVEPANYEEGSGRSRVCVRVCVCVGRGEGEGGGEDSGGVWIPPPKFKYPSELSTQYLAAVNCHEIDTKLAAWPSSYQHVELVISGPLKSSKLLLYEHEFFDKKMKQ